jgi:serine protease Do
MDAVRCSIPLVGDVRVLMTGSKHSRLFPGTVAGLVGLIVLLGSAAGVSAVAPPPPKEKLPDVLGKPAPASPQELRAMQEHVKKVLKLVVPATVGIRVGPAAGSGVIIDAEGHVLTAGHVSGRPNRPCVVILPDGRELKARTLGQNTAIDSGLIKITEKPEKGKTWSYIPMADSAKLKLGQWCLAVGQPGGQRPGRSPVVRLGRIQELSLSRARGTPAIIRSDCTLVGGDSGGPLFDMDGKVIGIHSRIGPDIPANIHVPVNAYRDDWDRLAKGDSWANLRRENSPYIGITFAFGKKDLVVTEIAEKSPAEKAGLKVGDVLTGIDDKNLVNRDQLADYMESRRVNDEITLEVLRDESHITFKLKLARRPAD